MKLYRVFTKIPASDAIREFGGPLYVPREFQGNGRHDIPDDGIIYCALDAVSAIAENIKGFINLTINNDDFKRKGKAVQALAEMAMTGERLIDLRDAKEMVKTKTGPMAIATHDREITKGLCKMIYDKQVDGFIWWSTIEAKWSNVTLFESRVKNKIQVQKIIPLTTAMADVKKAAKLLQIKLD